MMDNLFRYPLDPTGVNPANLVVGETHALPNRTVRAFAPSYGAFYTESVVITDVATGHNLTSSQFKSVELYEFPTGRYGKEICGVILVIDPAVSNNIAISYQALGGDYSTNTDAILQMLATVDLDDRPVNWPDILSKPAGFVPAMHYHDIGDIYGFEYLVHAVERVRDAILTGDDVSHDNIYKYIDAWGNSITGGNSNVAAALATHTNNVSNPHSTTKAQVGLSNVNNFAMATNGDGVSGSSATLYMSPATTAAAIASQGAALVAVHANNTSNPHSTTKAQVGLGNVQNYATASNTDGQTGTSTTLYMTPAATTAAIGSASLNPAISHINRLDNPHSTTAAQIGLGNVQNYGTASNSDGQAGSATNLYMTPASTAAAITSQAGALVTAHINNTSNPHNTTATQVGLGNVLNYGLATTQQAQAGAINTAYMTPALTLSAITTALASVQTLAAGDIVLSFSSVVPTNARRLLVQGQAVAISSYPSLIGLWCGATYNALNASTPSLQADFFYRCTDPANPSTTRANTGGYLVLPPAGYFLRPYNGSTTGADANRGLYKLQEDDVKGHYHNNGVSAYANGDGTGPFGSAGASATTKHAGDAGLTGTYGLTSTSGGAENLVKNYPVYVWLVY